MQNVIGALLEVLILGKGDTKESPVPSSRVQLSRRKALQVSPEHALPSTSWQVIQVQPKPAGKVYRVQVESKRSGKIREALPSGSTLKLGQDQNVRTVQILQSTRNQMPRVETDSTDNIHPRLKQENKLASKMSPMFPGTRSQVAQVEASPGRQEGVQVATDSMSSKLQVLPSPNGLVLQDEPCRKDLLVHGVRHAGGKLVEIGSKSYFVVGAHPKRGGRRSLQFPKESKKADSKQYSDRD